MKSKILVIENQSQPLAQLRKFFTKRSFQIIQPKETESIFNLFRTENFSAVFIDAGVYGKRSTKFEENLRNHILPPGVELFSISSENPADLRSMYRRISMHS